MSLKGLRPLSLFIASALLSLQGVSAGQGGAQFLGSKKLGYSEEQPILGISSIRYDQAHHQFILLSDDTGAVQNYYSKNAPSRFYSISADHLINQNGIVKHTSALLEATGDSIVETPIEPNHTVQGIENGQIDTEGFDFLEDNAFLVASEQNAVYPVALTAPWLQLPGWSVRSKLLKVGRDGSLLGVYYFPQEFSNTGWRFDLKIPHWVPIAYDAEFNWQSTDPDRKGVKRNRGFETVTKIPGTLNYLSITEQGILQDEKDWNYLFGPAPSRVLLFSMAESVNRVSDDIKPDAQYYYQPTSVPEKLYDPLTEVIVQSISDAQAINDHQLLVIEKNFIKKANRNTVNYSYSEVYLVDLRDPLPAVPFNGYFGNNSSAVKVSTIKHQTTAFPVLRKQLLVSTRDFEGTFPDFKRLNIEGVTLGPDGADGSKRLVLVSDNGASNPKPKSTDILFFRIPDKLLEMK
ncbi:esterase-like activity of phytase family protein [Endozoicomonas numazuensis]|uniref:Phytase-like domain-containing protein n=1 Tax=Endozoicomonas numazuensis TaxID=1137799 RepID=A0A081NE15_9GAMM|nr:esterase-like activity of phytase family protein [Endozoicomonas numazuensis]KEQ16688.1 hypothetical protein GZ78_18465 [Endozoicomonas numazuensis]